jgi:hypothetical protein
MNRLERRSEWRRGLNLARLVAGRARPREGRRLFPGSWVELLEDRRLLASSLTPNSLENLTGLTISAVQNVQTTQDIATFTSIDTTAVSSDFNATINWGDGTPSTAGIIAEDASDVFHVIGTHTYTYGGPFTPDVTIRDPNGTLYATGSFYQTNLVSSISGDAAVQDTNLINPWGMAPPDYGGTKWVSDQGSGLATVYDLTRPTTQSTVVTIPSDTPTGVIINEYPIDVAPSTQAEYLFATLGGMIAGWASGSSATTLATVDGARLTGLAEGGVTTGSAILTTTPYLYATDLSGTTGANGIDVFNQGLTSVTGPGGAFNGKFADPN